MTVEIGKLEIDPAQLPLTGSSPYWDSWHLFVVEETQGGAAETRLWIYVCVSRSHPGVVSNFNLRSRNINGGGSCYMDSEKQLVVGSESGTYGVVDPAYRDRFAALIADVLQSQGEEITGSRGVD